jgi:hypothetical protein
LFFTPSLILYSPFPPLKQRGTIFFYFRLENNLTPPLLSERSVIFTEGFSVRRRNEDEVAKKR